MGPSRRSNSQAVPGVRSSEESPAQQVLSFGVRQLSARRVQVASFRDRVSISLAMTHPLSESWAKIIRAKEHRGAFDAEVALWLREMEAKGEGAHTRFEYDPDSGRLAGFVGSVPEPPLYRFGLILGDVRHNLRGALDHLARELANRHSPDRGEDRVTQFPIALSARQFENMRGMMKHLDQVHRDMIEKEQPFATEPKSPENAPLAVLAELSNQDKHQGIRPVSVSHES